jgi:hypothetical protein
LPLITLNLNTILREQELELVMKDFLIHYLKRIKRSINIKADGTRFYLYNSDNLVFLITLREMDTNKLITKNPGYGR